MIKTGGKISIIDWLEVVQLVILEETDCEYREFHLVYLFKARSDSMDYTTYTPTFSKRNVIQLFFSV